MRRAALLLLALPMLAFPALAQEDAGSLSERLDRLERDVNFVQKQVYRSGGTATQPATGNGAPLPANAGPLQVRVAQIDEELRQIRGLIEQTQFQNKQTASELKKLSEDVDFRLRSIEQKQAQHPEATAPQAAVQAPPAVEAAKPATYKPESPEKPAAPTAAVPPATTDSNVQYSQAFRLLNEKKFAEAGAAFDSFVKKYPSDPLASNAYYWLGESHYARKDFTRSTESFRKGFEANPEGQKAPDNLYKLAMSLSQIKRTNEACVVLARVVEKYSDTAARTATKATEARTSLQCK